MPARNRCHLVQAGTGVQHGVAGGQFHATGAVGVADGQFAAVVVVGVVQKHRARHIGAHVFGATAVQGFQADGVVNVVAIGVGLAAVAVDAGREDAQRQGGTEKQSRAVQPGQHQLPDGRRRFAAMGQLLVVFDRAGLWSRAEGAVFPRGVGKQATGGGHVVSTQDVGQGDQHGFRT